MSCLRQQRESSLLVFAVKQSHFLLFRHGWSRMSAILSVAVCQSFSQKKLVLNAPHTHTHKPSLGNWLIRSDPQTNDKISTLDSKDTFRQAQTNRSGTSPQSRLTDRQKALKNPSDSLWPCITTHLLSTLVLLLQTQNFGWISHPRTEKN